MLEGGGPNGPCIPPGGLLPYHMPPSGPERALMAMEPMSPVVPEGRMAPPGGTMPPRPLGTAELAAGPGPNPTTERGPVACAAAAFTAGTMDEGIEGRPMRRSAHRQMWSDGYCGLGSGVPEPERSSPSEGTASTANGVMWFAEHQT
jgi:hypothetical protein